MKLAAKLLKKAKTIALISHTNPDPDTIGSTIGLCEILKKLGKTVHLFCDSELSESYAFLSAFEGYNKNEAGDFSNYDLVVAVDVPSEDRLGCHLDAFKSHANTLRIDHHVSGECGAKVNVVKDYSACALLIYDISKALKVKLNASIATPLYLAICGDTGIFRNTNTDSVTFEVCSKLFEAGAEFRKVYSEFFDKKTVPYLKLTSNALLGAEINEKEGFVVLSVSLSDYEKYEASLLENVGNLPHSYLNCGYKIAVILKEREDGIHCSLRSKFEYDVSKVAETFGGGGHKNASGCVIVDTLEGAKKQMKKAISNYLKSV